MKKFKLKTHSCIQVHYCVKAMIVDQQQELLYSTGKDRLIHCLDLKAKSIAGRLKVSNAQPANLAIDTE